MGLAANLGSGGFGGGIRFSDHLVVKPSKNPINLALAIGFSEIDPCDGECSKKPMYTVSWGPLIDSLDLKSQQSSPGLGRYGMGIKKISIFTGFRKAKAG